jgi:hypothetical protein
VGFRLWLEVIDVFHDPQPAIDIGSTKNRSATDAPKLQRS